MTQPLSRVTVVVLSERPALRLAWRALGEGLGLRVDDNDDSMMLARLRAAEPVILLADAGTVDAHLTGLQHWHSARTVVVAPDAAPSPVVSALIRGGSRWVVTLEDASADLARALVAAIDDVAFATPTGLAVILAVAQEAVGGRGRAQHDARLRLSARESEVLSAMVDGLGLKATAAALGVTVKTVEAHRRAVFRKLGASSKSEAITAALRDRTLLGRRQPRPGVTR